MSSTMYMQNGTHNVWFARTAHLGGLSDKKQAIMFGLIEC